MSGTTTESGENIIGKLPPEVRRLAEQFGEAMVESMLQVSFINPLR